MILCPWAEELKMEFLKSAESGDPERIQQTRAMIESEVTYREIQAEERDEIFSLTHDNLPTQTTI